MHARIGGNLFDLLRNLLLFSGGVLMLLTISQLNLKAYFLLQSCVLTNEIPVMTTIRNILLPRRRVYH